MLSDWVWAWHSSASACFQDPINLELYTNSWYLKCPVLRRYERSQLFITYREYISKSHNLLILEIIHIIKTHINLLILEIIQIIKTVCCTNYSTIISNMFPLTDRSAFFGEIIVTLGPLLSSTWSLFLQVLRY